LQTERSEFANTLARAGHKNKTFFPGWEYNRAGWVMGKGVKIISA